jgi:murein DD-endopeptidase MepM/ murein hydrolase activator NlpD
VVVNGPLETVLSQAAGPEIAPALTQVVTRALVWWVSVPADLRRGDKVELVYEERPGEEPLVYAVRFTSGKLSKAFRAYRFKGDGETVARYYQPGGDELELRLTPSPLDDYEQITSLIRDGRRHKGVDFRTPVGTPVKATFSGTITRRNWNWRSNGNCLEVTESAAPHRKAIFLHMSELPKTMAMGSPVARGSLVGSSGNSGHSFAPHLHYQLMSAADEVLDPFDGATVRRQLPPAQKAALDSEIHRLDGLMGTAVAAGN